MTATQRRPGSIAPNGSASPEFDQRGGPREFGAREAVGVRAVSWCTESKECMYVCMYVGRYVGR